jgi:hypothetical protein
VLPFFPPLVICSSGRSSHAVRGPWWRWNQSKFPNLKSVIKLPQPCFVGFLRCQCFVLGILFFEAGLIPALPGGERIVGCFPDITVASP